MAEELLEVTEHQRVRREEAAERLRALADQLSRRNQVEFTSGGIRHVAKVPDEVDLTIEIELGEESEIEVEISW